MNSEDIDLAIDLPRERMNDALACIAAWRADPQAVRACPVCEKEGLEIVDRSARPYSEWYAISCPACGLAANLQIPLAGPAAY